MWYGSYTATDMPQQRQSENNIIQITIENKDTFQNITKNKL